MTTIRDALRVGAAKLDAAGIEGALHDARALLAGATHLPAMKISLEPERPLNTAEQDLFDSFIARRGGREPVSKILGSRQFWGRDFIVTKDTLDPRPETEILIASALELGPVSKFLDLGTGTGIIPVTLLAEWPEAKAIATDISAACLKVAVRNAERHGVAKRLKTAHSDWFSDISGQFPLILSNPPYIAPAEMPALSRDVLDYDPHLALTDNDDGLAAYRQIISGAAKVLLPGGHLILEIGPTQAGAVSALGLAAGLEILAVKPDFDGRDRVVITRMPS